LWSPNFWALPKDCPAVQVAPRRLPQPEACQQQDYRALASFDRACRDHCPDFSATFTTIAFDDSSLRWLGISDLIAEPEGPSSLVQLRIAVWTGVTRDTRPVFGPP
jgi:hypothetical protein